MKGIVVSNNSDPDGLRMYLTVLGFCITIVTLIPKHDHSDPDCMRGAPDSICDCIWENQS